MPEERNLGKYAIKLIYHVLFSFTECKAPLGMKDRTISDQQISSSSVSGTCCNPKYARLDNDKRWLSDSSDNNKWIKIDLINTHIVTGIIVQGWDSWVATLRVKYEDTPGSHNLVHITDEGGNAVVSLGLQLTLGSSSISESPNCESTIILD